MWQNLLGLVKKSNENMSLGGCKLLIIIQFSSAASEGGPIIGESGYCKYILEGICRDPCTATFTGFSIPIYVTEGRLR